MSDVIYGNGTDLKPAELAEFYRRVKFDLDARPDQIRRMLSSSAALVTARVGGELIGLARGLNDGVRGYLTECKLDPAFQGPAAVTRTDGRIEHDTAGVAAEMARRILDKLFADGVQRVDVVAWGTEEDFLAELGFRRSRGMVGMTLRTDERSVDAGATTASFVAANS